MLDLFQNHRCANIWKDEFRWALAVFRQKGALEAMRRAKANQLMTYYPVKFNTANKVVPLWSNYLFIEFKRSLTMQICRCTSNFIRIVSAENIETGENEPILIRRNAIDESMQLFMNGFYNESVRVRPFYGYGSLVKINDGDFAGKRVRLLCDIPSDMSGNKRIVVDLEGWKVNIEIFKLNL